MGRSFWANQAELKLLGYRREEYIGHSITEFHVDQPVIGDILQRLTSDETLNGYEARLRCKDGSTRYVSINSSVYREDGRFVHTRCVTLDISGKKEAAELQERLAAIVSSSDDAIISKNLHGIVMSWNRGAERYSDIRRTRSSANIFRCWQLRSASTKFPLFLRASHGERASTIMRPSGRRKMAAFLRFP
jgi:PAS domain S-box-containing protein